MDFFFRFVITLEVKNLRIIYNSYNLVNDNCLRTNIYMPNIQWVDRKIYNISVTALPRKYITNFDALLFLNKLELVQIVHQL